MRLQKNGRERNRRRKTAVNVKYGRLDVKTARKRKGRKKKEKIQKK